MLQRPNLTVLINTPAHRVLLESGIAVGVEVRRGRKTRRYYADREVVLSGGTINTPQLLMLSGIGDPDELSEVGISPRVALPGVGKNLQDHLVTLAAYSRREPGPFHYNLRFDRIATSIVEAQLFGRGYATDLPCGMMAFLKSDPTIAVPDTQLLFHAGSLAAAPYLSPFRKPFADGFSCRAVLLRPESRGSLKLAGTDPEAAIRIHWNFLATESDRLAMRASWRAMREVARQKPMQAFVQDEILPSAAVQSDAEVDAHIRGTAMTAHHPLGTCRMGVEGDALAVVDPELRVFGVERLRVVDASVMPDMIGGNINAAVIMIAERAADLIRHRVTLQPIFA